jgi:hypothetical protein
MNEKELNRKLAEWAGFVLKPCHPGCVPHWHRPDGEALNLIDDFPTFTQSLDACFKWLMPKLFTWNIGKNWELCSDTEIRPNKVKAQIQSLGFNNPEFRAEAIAETPALALCLAIEKLVDSEVMSRG